MVVSSSFIGSFKLGDNIAYNLDVLELLYSKYREGESEEGALLRKPIIILIASIIEAVLYDFHFKVKHYTGEGVRNLATSAVYTIRLKKIDELAKYIASARKHDLFEQRDSDFYDQMDELRKLRNRVHIQNTKKHFEPDDEVAFSAERKLMAERVLERTLRTMADKYSRDHNYVRDFVLPWEPHFEN